MCSSSATILHEEFQNYTFKVIKTSICAYTDNNAIGECAKFEGAVIMILGLIVWSLKKTGVKL